MGKWRQTQKTRLFLPHKTNWQQEERRLLKDTFFKMLFMFLAIWNDLPWFIGAGYIAAAAEVMIIAQEKCWCCYWMTDWGPTEPAQGFVNVNFANDAPGSLQTKGSGGELPAPPTAEVHKDSFRGVLQLGMINCTNDPHSAIQSGVVTAAIPAWNLLWSQHHHSSSSQSFIYQSTATMMWFSQLLILPVYFIL